MKSRNSTAQGIVCFGSALVRVAPDYAALTFKVSQVDESPKLAFQKAKEIARQLNSLFQQQSSVESRSSNVGMEDHSVHRHGEWQHLGYKASITTNVIVKDLSLVENIITSAIETGAQNISAFTFGTTAMKELRAKARRHAVQAATEKAENYCAAAGVKLGAVIGIEDVNPDHSQPYRESRQTDEGELGASEDGAAIDPGAICVKGSVRIRFEIQPE